MRFSTSFAALAGAIAAAMALVPSAFAGNGIGVGIPAVPALPATPGLPALTGIAAVKPTQHAATLSVPMTVVQRSVPKQVKTKHATRTLCSRRLAAAVTTVLPVEPGPWTNSCTGEQVILTGTQNMAVNTSVDSNGQGHVYIQDNWQKTSGTALVTGTKYSANDATHTFERDYVPGAENTILVEDEFELVSNGPQPNMILRSKIEMVVDADGVPIKFNAVQFTVDCPG
jgi:hypothetical protein